MTVEETTNSEAQQQSRKEFAENFQFLMSIPANRVLITEMMLGTCLEALKLQKENHASKMLRPVVTSTYYEGSLRVTVLEPAEGSSENDVLIEEEHIEDNDVLTWVPAVLDDEWKETIRKLVLSNVVASGDVVYMTTNRAVENQMEKVTDFFQKRMEEQDQENANAQ